MIMSVDLDDLGERIATHAAHLDAATHTLLTDLREFDVAGGWYKQGARSCADWLSWRVGWNMGTAREHLRVARRLAELPLIDDALRRGAISYVKVRAITRVATSANEATLLTDAQYSTGSQLERICRKYAAVVPRVQGTGRALRSRPPVPASLRSRRRHGEARRHLPSRGSRHHLGGARGGGACSYERSPSLRSCRDNGRWCRDNA